MINWKTQCQLIYEVQHLQKVEIPPPNSWNSSLVGNHCTKLCLDFSCVLLVHVCLWMECKMRLPSLYGFCIRLLTSHLFSVTSPTGETGKESTANLPTRFVPFVRCGLVNQQTYFEGLHCFFLKELNLPWFNPVVLKLGSARQFSGDREAPSKKINWYQRSAPVTLIQWKTNVLFRVYLCWFFKGPWAI